MFKDGWPYIKESLTNICNYNSLLQLLFQIITLLNW